MCVRQEAGELMNYAADGNISLFPGVDLKLRFNSYRVFLWVKSMLFIVRFEAFDDVCDIVSNMKPVWSIVLLFSFSFVGF